MARSTQETIELGRLIRRSEAARLQIGLARTKLKRKLDLPSRIGHSVKSEPMKWLGGSATVGFLGSFFLGSRRKRADRKLERRARKGPFPIRLLQMLVRLGKPAAKIYATKVIKDYLEARLKTGAAGGRGIGTRDDY